MYTMEVLTKVLQQLMEQNEIPLLLMRTVIQSMALYSNLIRLHDEHPAEADKEAGVEAWDAVGGFHQVL